MTYPWDTSLKHIPVTSLNYNSRISLGNASNNISLGEVPLTYPWDMSLKHIPVTSLNYTSRISLGNAFNNISLGEVPLTYPWDMSLQTRLLVSRNLKGAVWSISVKFSNTFFQTRIDTELTHHVSFQVSLLILAFLIFERYIIEIQPKHIVDLSIPEWTRSK